MFFSLVLRVRPCNNPIFNFLKFPHYASKTYHHLAGSLISLNRNSTSKDAD